MKQYGEPSAKRNQTNIKFGQPSNSCELTTQVRQSKIYELDNHKIESLS